MRVFWDERSFFHERSWLRVDGDQHSRRVPEHKDRENGVLIFGNGRLAGEPICFYASCNMLTLQHFTSSFLLVSSCDAVIFVFSCDRLATSLATIAQRNTFPMHPSPHNATTVAVCLPLCPSVLSILISPMVPGRLHLHSTSSSCLNDLTSMLVIRPQNRPSKPVRLG
jgi:hypothetical protein